MSPTTQLAGMWYWQLAQFCRPEVPPPPLSNPHTSPFPSSSPRGTPYGIVCTFSLHTCFQLFRPHVRMVIAHSHVSHIQSPPSHLPPISIFIFISISISLFILIWLLLHSWLRATPQRQPMVPGQYIGCTTTSVWWLTISLFTWMMDSPQNFASLKNIKGLKIVHYNVRSLIKKMDQIRLLLNDTPTDVLTISETWLQPHLSSGLIQLKDYKAFRLDRNVKRTSKKGAGGLVTFVSSKYASQCEPLEDLDISNQNIEAQWVYVHQLNCKDTVICNVYRPPTGDLSKAITYLEDCLQSFNMGKTDLFVLGDFNVNYMNKKTPDYKKLHFFVQANGLSQHIGSTTRNSDKSKSLIDLALTNSKFVSCSGTLDHYLSDHQPIYVVHKKSRDTRQSVSFKGRSYRNYNHSDSSKRLTGLDWEGYFKLQDSELAWEFILNNITLALDSICPIRNFHIKNYRPDWMTKELIAQIQDRDYFYHKAKTTGDQDAWNIAKHLRNVTYLNIRQAKREFILHELNEHNNDAKKFWKVIHKVIPAKKSHSDQDILLKHDGIKIDRSEVSTFINDYFINVGKVNSPPSPSPSRVTDSGQTYDLSSSPLTTTNQDDSEESSDPFVCWR